MMRACLCLLMGAMTVLGCADDPIQRQASVAPRVLVRREPASAAQCPQGGSVISAGVDLDISGVLDEDEIETRQVVCDGPPPPPPAALVGLVAEPAGVHCSAGGTAVQRGLDDNGNGRLDPAEVTDVSYLCGEVLVTRLAQEPPGSRCAAGGVAILAGRDRDHDGVLGADEVELSEVACGDVLTRDVAIHSNADAAALAKVRVLTGTLTVTALDVETLALPNLQYVDGALVVDATVALHTLALPSLERVTGELTLAGELAVVEAPRLQRVGRLSLQLVTGLIDLRGFPALTQVDGDVAIFKTSLVRAELSLASLGGGLFVGDNPQLEDVRFAVTDTHHRPALGSTSINGNPRLARVALSADAALEVSVASNDQLAQVSVAVGRVERMLLVSGGTVPCALTLDSPRTGDLTVGDRLILGGPLQSLETTRRVVVSGRLVLFHTQLVSLDNIAVARGGLGLTENPRLVQVGPIEVGTNLEVVGNAALETLSSLSFVGELAFLYITRNPALIEAPALAGVKTAQRIVILENQVLAHVPLLQLAWVHRLDVLDNPAIQTIEMPALVTAESQIEMRNNPQLQHLDLRALAHAALLFFDNRRLPTCELLALFARVTGPAEQAGNDDTATCTDGRGPGQNSGWTQ